MTAAFASASGFATPIAVSRSTVPDRQQEGGPAADDARRKNAADAILRAAGAMATGEA